MLIEFRVKNFRSVRDEQSLNLTASTSHEMENGHVFVSKKSNFRLLKSAAIYGANASGKSNVLQGAAFMRHFVLKSAEGQAGDKIEVESFRLDQEFASQPSSFEVHFIHDEVRYQYGFSADKKRVRREWLLAYPFGKPQRWIERSWNTETEEMEWEFGPNFKGDRIKLSEMTRENTLYLSLGVKFNHPQLTPVFKWFRECLSILTAPMMFFGRFNEFTAEHCENDKNFQVRIARLLTESDLGINDLKVESRILTEDDVPDDAPEEIKQWILGRKDFDIKTIHQSSMGKGSVAFDLSDESDGTQRLFALAGKWLDVLDHGYTLFIDELDASMHPLLARKLVSLFHDPGINKKGAQLVFTTHDTTLLDKSLFRCDQIMFTEKEERGATRLYSLLEYSPRKSEALQKGYLAGRYGALPFLGDFHF